MEWEEFHPNLIPLELVLRISLRTGIFLCPRLNLQKPVGWISIFAELSQTSSEGRRCTTFYPHKLSRPPIIIPGSEVHHELPASEHNSCIIALRNSLPRWVHVSCGTPESRIFSLTTFPNAAEFALSTRIFCASANKSQKPTMTVVIYGTKMSAPVRWGIMYVKHKNLSKSTPYK